MRANGQRDREVPHGSRRLRAQGRVNRPLSMAVTQAAALECDDVLARLDAGTSGLPTDEAARRLRMAGPNAVRSYRARAWPVLRSHLRSPLLLAVTALASAFLGQASDAVIIGVILIVSVGLGFVNEYRASKTAEALHSSIHHRCVVWRDGHSHTVDVTELVPGYVVDLQLGQVVPADMRLLTTAGLECDESVLTGESLPVEKSAEPIGFIRKFMIFFGPISSIFDFITFGYRVHRRAGRFTARTLHPAGRPDPDRKPAAAGAAGVPGDAPGAPLDGKHGTSAPSA
jgi:E1-E2 ATPase/Cation transporter/ATPase, N-terminus